MKKYKEESNPARKFLVEHYHATSLGQIQCCDLYAAYRRWCEVHGNSPTAEGPFGKEVVRVFPRVDRQRIGRGIDRRYFYIGIDDGGEDEVDDEIHPKGTDAFNSNGSEINSPDMEFHPNGMRF